MKTFASDNTVPAHPLILKSLEMENQAWASAYGADSKTVSIEKLFQKHFGSTAQAFPVFNGTGANVTAISSCMLPHEAVICPDTAHLQVDECGALEKFAGVKILALPTKDGKLRPEQIDPFLVYKGDPHRVQPRVISISQTTELGTVYSSQEVKALADFAHAHKMFLHVDGARFSNAVVSLNGSLKSLSADLGVDVLSFGGTKNGMLLGEAVVFFNQPQFAERFHFVRKQAMQLASKMRYLSCQFEAYLEKEIWKTNALHANEMAQRLYKGVSNLEAIPVLYPVQANAIFVRLSPPLVERLQKDFYFYVVDPKGPIARWMTSWNTTPTDVDQFLAAIASS